ncbi:right-handed parallel beta-helix repeat-containing protein [Candidatus Poribacteria bacterium]|nr:right-handed parallel beta-helix repeat-containing protein [Candidatus Poribacteria bacterium]
MTQKSSDGRFLHGQKWERFSVQEAQADFYVALNGNDSWSGTLPSPDVNNNPLTPFGKGEKNDGPFATIERAQEAVRSLKQQVYSEKKPPIEKRFIGSPHKYGAGKDILVLIRGGYYSLDKPLNFGPDDGGERVETDLPTGAFEFHKLKDHFVTYAAYPGETPIISGGKKITSWRQEKGEWVTDVKGEGHENLKGHESLMAIKKILANGKAQILARTPNEGYFTPPEIPESTTEFKFREGDLKQWPDMKNNRIIMLLRWHKGVNSIAKIDMENNMVHLAEPQPGIVVVPPRYYIENVEALLDAPGEWFFNAETGKLSYIPAEGIDDPNKANIVTPVLSQLMIIKGEPEKPIRNLRFYGLAFEATNTGDSAISFVYATNCEFVDSEVRGAGNTAIQLGKGCYLNRILNNTIQGADEGGINISGGPHPDWVDLIHGNIVSYNYVSDCGGASIHVSNTRDTIVSHNEITNTRGRTPLQVGGWSNVEVAIEGGYRVEYNHIHHVQVGSDDSGAITTAGFTTNSIIRGNLIHDVSPSFFNENVAFWFDNMSFGWTVVENIYYNLKQSEMKLCASLLSDNIYQDNFLIETPENEPERIIEGQLEVKYGELKIEKADNSGQADITTGQVLKVSAETTNTGATGIATLDLYIDGKVAESKKFPVVHNNTRTITFDVVFYEPGEHRVAVGSTPYQTININGKPLQFLYTDLNVSAPAIPVGEEIIVSATVENVRDYQNSDDVNFYMDGKVIDSKSITLLPRKSEKVSFRAKPEKGIYKVGIGNTTPVIVEVYPHHAVDIAKCELQTHCSGTARPCEFKMDKANNCYTIIAGGTDFLHAEDSYGAIYLKGVIKGNFVATLKVAQFAENVNPWYRAGIFVRNDIAKSHETEPGSLSSVLMYTTPKLSGFQWDEFGDGCMHKCGDRSIYETENPFPVWLKLVRHGDTFTGYTSCDGVNWGEPKHSTPIPGWADAMDIGMAAGTIDQVPALVVLEDFTLEVEDEGWK